MRDHLLAVLLVLAVPSIAAAQKPLDATRVGVSSPRLLATFSTDELHGYPMRMTWSPDGRDIYLRVIHSDRWGNETIRHYVLALDGAPGGSGPSPAAFRPAEREPDWSGSYWAWKSGLNCPGAGDWTIAMETRVERKSATNSGAGGGLAQNSGDPYFAGASLGPQGQAILIGAMVSQQVTTTTLKVKGVLLSEFVNTPVVAGLMYGWAPEGVLAIVYRGGKGALTIMDRTGRRHELAGTKGVILPMWSGDGQRIAWLAQKGHNKYDLLVADVTRR